MATNPDPKSDAVVVRELARLAEENVPCGRIDMDDGRTFLARRNDFLLEQITLANNADVLMPKVAAASVAIDTAASLIDYVNRFKNPDTVLFANESENTVTAVIDFHKQSNGNDVPARLGLHTATLTLAHSDQWETWTETDEKLMRHVDFATFLEENQFDVVRPNGADLLEICRDLQVKEGFDFSSAIRMGDTVKIDYQKDNDVSSKSSIGLPINIDLSIPVFFGEPNVRLMAWMRRKVDRGTLSLGYKMSQRDVVVAAGFARIVSQIKAGVDGLTTVYGARS